MTDARGDIDPAEQQTTSLQRIGDVYLLALGGDENRFSPDWLASTEAALDTVLNDPAPLVTVGRGKFYSNGLDLDWVVANPDKLPAYRARVHALLAKVLTLPVPTVAAVNGHAFGAGAMLALAHDWRVMREDRGYFCFPEVDIHIPFTPGMAALIQAKLTAATAVTAMTTGRRYDGPSALNAGIVDVTADDHSLLAVAIERVRELAGKDPTTLGAIKDVMYCHSAERLRSADYAATGDTL